MYRNTAEAKKYIILKDLADHAHGCGDWPRYEELELEVAEYAANNERKIFAESSMDSDMDLTELLKG